MLRSRLEIRRFFIAIPKDPTLKVHTRMVIVCSLAGPQYSSAAVLNIQYSSPVDRILNTGMINLILSTQNKRNGGQQIRESLLEYFDAGVGIGMGGVRFSTVVHVV